MLGKNASNYARPQARSSEYTHLSVSRVCLGYLIQRSEPADTVCRICPQRKVNKVKVYKAKKREEVITEDMSIYEVHHYLQLMLEGKYVHIYEPQDLYLLIHLSG